MGLAVFIIIFVILVVDIYISSISPKLKGEIGEHRVCQELEKISSKNYLILNDVLLKYKDSSTQIDHIVISRNGIFVIETKNYKGWIFGNEKSQYWTQIIYKNKFKFINPIKQNWRHIFVLKNILSEYSNLKIYPIVVFSGSARLMKINSHLPVIKINELLKTIKNKNETCLSYADIQNIYNKLNTLNLTSSKDKKRHIKQIKENIYKYKKTEKELICPQCGGKLIIKNGKYGKFYACSNYPKCRYTKKIKN